MKYRICVFIVLISQALLFESVGQKYIPYLNSNNKYSIYNCQNSTFLSPNEFYDDAKPTIIERFILLKKIVNFNAKWGLFDSNSGKFILPLNFENIIVKRDYIEGQQFNEFEYKNLKAKDFYINLSIFDFTGTRLFRETNATNFNLNNYGSSYIKEFERDYKNDSTLAYPYKILFSKNGVMLLDNSFNIIFKKAQIKYIDYLKGDILIFSYEDIHDQIYPYPKFGLLNISGKIIVEPKYNSLSINDNELIPAKTDFGTKKENSVYIDLKGKIIIPFKNYLATPFTKGLAIVSESELTYSKKQLKVINTKGEIIVNNYFDKKKNISLTVEEIINDFILVSYTKKNLNFYNLINKKSHLMFKNYYQKLSFLKNEKNLLVQDLEGFYKIIDLTEKTIFRFEDKNVVFNSYLDNLITYKYSNSKNWQSINYDGKSIEIFEVDTSKSILTFYNKKLLIKNKNENILCEINGEEIVRFHELTWPNNWESAGLNEKDINKLQLSNKFLVYEIKTSSLENTKNKSIWYDAKSRIEYSELKNISN